MARVFLIPGLGADTRIFNNINVDSDDVVCIDWIEPDKTDTLTTYAQKLIFQYNIRPGSILIGNSLGGMLAVEMANYLPIRKLILISSIKTIYEAPAYFKFFRAIPVYKLVPINWLNSAGFAIEVIFGKMNETDKWLFKDMLKKSPPEFLKWAIAAVLLWKNKTVPPNVFQVIGDKDRVFSYLKQKDATVIKGGTHIMIFDRAMEVNKFLKNIRRK